MYSSSLLLWTFGLLSKSLIELWNRKNRISKRRFRHDSTRYERWQQRVHRGEAIGLCSHMTCHGLGLLLIYDGRLNSSLIYWSTRNIFTNKISKIFSWTISTDLISTRQCWPTYMTQGYLKKKKLNRQQIVLI